MIVVTGRVTRRLRSARASEFVVFLAGILSSMVTPRPASREPGLHKPYETAWPVRHVGGQYLYAKRTTTTAQAPRSRRSSASRTWLYEAAKTGRIPAIRIGGRKGSLRFVPEDLQRWIDDARAEWVPGRHRRR